MILSNAISKMEGNDKCIDASKTSPSVVVGVDAKSEPCSLVSGGQRLTCRGQEAND